MRTKLKLKIDHAHSMDNGIRFYSKRHKGYVAISTIDELGNIKVEWTTMKKYQKAKSKNDKIAEVKEFFMFMLFIMPFLLPFSMLLTWAMDVKKDSLLSMRIFLLGYALFLLGIFIVTNCVKRRKEKNSLKFHSAEHMVLNAYRKLKRVPSLEEIRQYSRFSNSCGTNATTQLVINFILMFICTFIHNPLHMAVGMLVTNVGVFILLQCGFLNFLQNFSTIIPTDKELIVAISGMNVWLENERKEAKSRFSKFLHRLFSKSF